MTFLPRLLTIATLLALALCGAANAAARLPDEGIRRRLDGCYLTQESTAWLCFDGVERVELLAAKGNQKTATGTYTVLDGRLMLDLTPASNPRNETYPSCLVHISSEQTPTGFKLDHCLHWGDVNAALRAAPDRKQMAFVFDIGKRMSTDLPSALSDRRQGNGAAPGATLVGCWNELPSRDFQRDLAKDPTIVGSVEICFDDPKRGTTLTTSFAGGGTFIGEDGKPQSMGFDGWDDTGIFKVENGKLMQDDLSCSFRLTKTHLSLFDCVYLVAGTGGKLRVSHALEPSEYERSK